MTFSTSIIDSENIYISFSGPLLLSHFFASLNKNRNPALVYIQSKYANGLYHIFNFCE